MSYNDVSLYPPPYNATCARPGCQNPSLYDNGAAYLFCSVACATLYQRDMALTRCRNPACLRQFCNDLVNTCPYCSTPSISIPVPIPVHEDSPLLTHQYNDEGDPGDPYNEGVILD
ncbi:hypothetical protein GLOIN_2v1576591 [Rhizophagus clarus]|uniref:Uncharacterized protein n=1 Tax=Rhizophagus clarus TaxID=94130 RepID=A0A8H3L7Y2_9GLOM|nr:hypothetical protein GLOIN_2v1576591 [Rhizophagus clarus]